MEDSKAMISFGDIMSILLACIMLIAACLAVRANNEYQLKIQLLEHQAPPSLSNMTAGENLTSLTMDKQGRMVLEGGGVDGAQEVAKGGLAEVLTRLRPATLILRADEKLSHGDVLAVLLLCQDLGIIASLAAAPVKGG